MRSGCRADAAQRPLDATAAVNVELTVDPQAAGKQFGVLCVPAPRRADPFRTLNLPVGLIGDPSGPVVTFVGGGPNPAAGFAIAALMRSLEPGAVRGQVRLLPHLASGCGARRRRPPGAAVVDGAARALLPGSTLVVELGADEERRRDWADIAMLTTAPDRRHGSERAEAALIAFGADHSLRLAPGTATRRAVERQPDVLLGPDEPPVAGEPASLAEHARRSDIDAVSVRGHRQAGRDGGAARLLGGCLNMLVQLGMIDDELELRASRALAASLPSALVRTPLGGQLALCARPGAEVHQGDPLAHVHDPEHPQHEPAPVRAPRSGILVATRHDGLVLMGDDIAFIAEPMQG